MSPMKLTDFALEMTLTPLVFELTLLVKGLLNKNIWLEDLRLKAFVRQDSIPVGCVPLASQPYVFWWPPLDVSTSGGGGVGEVLKWTTLKRFPVMATRSQ